MPDLFLRQILIRRLQTALQVQPSVQAVWLEGADALDRADEYSDLDLWLDVDAGSEEEALQTVRAAVLTFGPLDVEQVSPHPNPLIRQRFYRSAGLPPFLFVDVCVQTHGRDMAFGPADAFLPLFDWAGILRRETPPTPDLAEEVGKALEQRWRWVLVEKELRRGHGLEALAYYHAEVLEPLLRLLRLRHSPEKYGYGLKHSSADLPTADLQRLEALYARTGPHELRAGMREAGEWMDRLTAEWP